MDPNAAYEMMITAARAEDWEKAGEHADNLRVWLAGGGFAPDAPNARHFITSVLERAESWARGQTIAEINGMGMA